MTNDETVEPGIAEQIKARVRQADQERITKRAEAAAAVAVKLQKRDDLSVRIAALDKELSGLISAATTDLMTAKELANFVGVKPTDLLSGSPRRASRERRVTAPD